MHTVERKIYFNIFGILLFLTVVTTAVAFIDLGRWNAVVALTIAVSKALLVVLYFMHVRYSSRLTWVVLAGGLFWLGIMIALTMSDYLSRHWIMRN